MKEIVKYEVQGVLFDSREEAEEYEKQFNEAKYIMYTGEELTTSIHDANYVFLTNADAAKLFIQRAKKEKVCTNGINEWSSGLFYFDYDYKEYRDLDRDVAYGISNFLKEIEY